MGCGSDAGVASWQHNSLKNTLWGPGHKSPNATVLSLTSRGAAGGRCMVNILLKRGTYGLPLGAGCSCSVRARGWRWVRCCSSMAGVSRALVHGSWARPVQLRLCDCAACFSLPCTFTQRNTVSEEVDLLSGKTRTTVPGGEVLS